MILKFLFQNYKKTRIYECVDLNSTIIEGLLLEPFATGNTTLCVWIFKRPDNITVHVVKKEHLFRISSELLENYEEMLPCY